jgi:hypothetical protein
MQRGITSSFNRIGIAVAVLVSITGAMVTGFAAANRYDYETLWRAGQIVERPQPSEQFMLHQIVPEGTPPTTIRFLLWNP